MTDGSPSPSQGNMPGAAQLRLMPPLARPLVWNTSGSTGALIAAIGFHAAGWIQGFLVALLAIGSGPLAYGYVIAMREEVRHHLASPN